MLSKFINSYSAIGLSGTLYKTIRFIYFLTSQYLIKFYSIFTLDGRMYARRLKISNVISREFNGVVRYGVFKGFNLGDHFRWGKADVASMLLGFYEEEVQEALALASKKYDTLIDLGGADGYFSVGCLVSNMFDSVHCFEISNISQENIKRCAVLNNVSDRLFIHGKATSKFYEELENGNVDLSKCLILCDIEGGEFDVFDAAALKKFINSTIIIEIHEWHQDGLKKYEGLKRKAAKFFKVSELTTTSRDLSIYPELKFYSDNDRWLLCSEGRGQLMKWLKLEPK